MKFVFAHISEDDIDSIVTLEGDSREVHALSPDSSIPPTLSSLTWNSDLDKNQRDIALIFLSKHRENFALDLSELGKTGARKHKIEVKSDSKPVRLQFYRTSPQASKEIENQFADILRTT